MDNESGFYYVNKLCKGFEKIVLGGEIMHIFWLRKIYSYMGYSYFSNKNNDIVVFEYLLFLVQFEVLQNKKKSFLKEKIYIDGNKIRIKYISDLIRVRPFVFVRGLGENLDSLNEYVSIMQKYLAMGEDQIKKEVLYIINEKNWMRDILYLKNINLVL